MPRALPVPHRTIRRESQVILDSRRCPRLATESGVLREGCRQSLRCTVDRGRKSGRSTADDEQVAHFAGICVVRGRRGKSQCVEERPTARVAQELTTWDHNDRQVRKRHVEPLEECLGRGLELRARAI